ncbi:MAG: alpha-mannosidase, partial [Clostridia bacterium]|nr:alpha-mannosidase [Clostridia bacterium]
AAVLNDCKYGISMNGSALQLSLLRAAACPEMRADNGKHEFRYAFLGWEGPFLESPVVREACDLNVPLQTAEGGCESFSAFQVNRANILIDTVKPAEDGSGDLILRMYEAKQADTTCELIIHLPLQRVMLCDMLENAADQLLPDKGCITLHFHPFEVKTLRLIRKA